ncbi:MAG: hypothetical protein K0Q58_514, partial [Microbacterium sp.]|nr:hypothetical protein [Microbacterium sp.]
MKDTSPMTSTPHPAGLTATAT